MAFCEYDKLVAICKKAENKSLTMKEMAQRGGRKAAANKRRKKAADAFCQDAWWNK